MPNADYKETPSSFLRIFTALLIASALCFGLIGSLGVGAVSIDSRTIIESLTHFNADSVAHVIVHDGRMPRGLADVLVGAALALAGAIMQAVTRNPLAGPGIMGLNSGAAFMTIVASIYFPTLGRGSLLSFALAGAALGAILVYGIGSLSRGGLTPVRLALTGIAVGTLLGAVGNGITIYENMGQDLLFWFARGAEGVRWVDLQITAPLIIVGFVGAIALAPGLGATSLGEGVARGIGQNPARTKFFSAVVVVALAGGAAALVGPVGFVGLLTPHIARALVGNDYRLVLPGAAVCGATLTLYADMIARLATVPLKTQIPLGVVTSLIGVPFFLYLVNKRAVARARRAS